MPLLTLEWAERLSLATRSATASYSAAFTAFHHRFIEPDQRGLAPPCGDPVYTHGLYVKPPWVLLGSTEAVLVPSA